jgi:hypothetical protein
VEKAEDQQVVRLAADNVERRAFELHLHLSWRRPRQSGSAHRRRNVLPSPSTDT